MNKLKKQLLRFLPRFYTEKKTQKLEEIRFCAAAREAIAARKDMSKTEQSALYEKWYADYKRYNVTFSEYYTQYRFPSLSEEQKREYISVSTMQKIYRLCGKESVRKIFRCKPEFLRQFRPYIHREWMVIDEKTDLQALDAFLSKRDVILKPIAGTRGEGISKIVKGSMTADALLRSHSGQWIAEECIVSDARLAAFHPSSLNTIRFVTFSNGTVCKPVLAFFRTGSGGGIVDNYHGGGISAQIDIRTGIITSDGKGENGVPRKVHPDTGIPFAGTQIPMWQEITDCCTRAALSLPGIRFAGWDVAINADGQIEFVEGNHAPDMDIPQSLANHGLRSLLLGSMTELGIAIPHSI